MMGADDDDADKEDNAGGYDDGLCMVYDGWCEVDDVRWTMHDAWCMIMDDVWWLCYDDDDDGVWVDIVPKTGLLTISMTLCRLLMKAIEFPEKWAIGPIRGTFWYHVSLL